MGRVLWPCGWLRGTASIYGVIPRCREERIFPLHTIVNSAPAEGCVRPVLAPAGAFVRAGAGRRGVGGLIGAFCVRITPAVRFCWDVLRWFASVDMFVLRLISPAIRFYWSVLRSVHACLFSFVRKRETACDVLHFYSARGRDRLSAFSDVVRLSGFAWFTSGLCVSLRRSRRRTKGREERSRRRKYVFAQTSWPCHVFRGENAGAEMWKPHCGRPRLRQRAIGSLDSLHLIRGVSTLLRKPLGLAVFSAGSTLGLRVPNLRQRVFDSLDSLHLIRGGVPPCQTLQ